MVGHDVLLKATRGSRLKNVENHWIRPWRIRWTDMYTKDRNSAGTDKEV